MAPEVLNPSDGFDNNASKADIWSFGITLIELLRGRPPLYYLSPRAAMATIPRTSPPRLESDDPRASKTLRDLIHACLHDDTKKRPSAGQLLKSFKSYFKQQKNSLMPGSLSRFKKSENGPDSMQLGSTIRNQPVSETIHSQWDFDLVEAEEAEKLGEEDVEGESNSISDRRSIAETKTEIIATAQTAETPSLMTDPILKDSANLPHVNTLFTFRKLNSCTKPRGGWENKDISILPIPCPSDAPNLDKILPQD